MLGKPGLSDELLIACLRDAFGVDCRALAFLPLGADVHSAVYRATATDGGDYFVKLRSGEFNPASVLVPYQLSRLGIAEVIPPLVTREGTLWTTLEQYTVTLQPFIDGEDGFDRALTDRQWHALGSALSRMHAWMLPAGIMEQLPRESFSPHWRERMRMFQELVDRESFADPVARQLATELRSRRDTVSTLVDRAGRLADELRVQPLEMVLCHGDIHAGNVLLGEDDRLYVVDWDTVVLAPKERDLMFPGAGIGQVWNTDREVSLFLAGYGPVEIDSAVMAYYRYERIVQDFAEFCEQLLLSDKGGDDRAQSLRYFTGQFQQGDAVDMALRSDARLWPD